MSSTDVCEGYPSYWQSGSVVQLYTYKSFSWKRRIQIYPTLKVNTERNPRKVFYGNNLGKNYGWYALYCNSLVLYYCYCITSISTDIRQELGKRHCRDDFDEKARKRHLINRQDCRNACRKVKDFKNHRHEDDAISVDRIVKELQQEDPSPIIAYKPVGEKDGQLQKSNFLLAMMTNFQATMFRKFPELVCVDSTHKTNEYGYKLVTVLVADEFKNGKLILCICIVGISGPFVFVCLFGCVVWLGLDKWLPLWPHDIIY